VVGFEFQFDVRATKAKYCHRCKSPRRFPTRDWPTPGDTRATGDSVVTFDLFAGGGQDQAQADAPKAGDLPEAPRVRQGEFRGRLTRSWALPEKFRRRQARGRDDPHARLRTRRASSCGSCGPSRSTSANGGAERLTLPAARWTPHRGRVQLRDARPDGQDNPFHRRVPRDRPGTSASSSLRSSTTCPATSSSPP